MNFIDKIKIRRNPNIIDSLSRSKIDEETINYAINKGYKFNSQTINQFESYLIYRNTFKYEPEFLEYQKNQAKKETYKLKKLYDIYGKNEFIKMLKQDDELAHLALQQGIVRTKLKEEDIIQIIDEKNDLIEFTIKNYSIIKDYQSQALANFIVMLKTPQELLEMGIDIYDFEKAFIESAIPENIIQLLQNKKGLFSTEIQDIERIVNENIKDFISHLEQIDNLCFNRLINDEIKQKTIIYVKENNIVYNESVPEFVLCDEEYVLMCLQQEPELMQKLTNKSNLKIDFEKYPDIANKIAKKIEEEKTSFEEIPIEYQICKGIYESIIHVNPELLQKQFNRYGLQKITKEMSEEEIVEYYRKIDLPFNASTVDANNFTMVLACLKNDYMTLANFEREFSIEQYKQIYETLKDSITAEEILSSKFLTQNPFFVGELLKGQIDLTKVNLQETKGYEQFYPTLKAIAIKRGVEIPEPKDYKDIIKFKGNTVYVNLDNLESVKKGLEYLKTNEIEQELNIELKQCDGDEFIIADNLEYFKELQKNGINLNFKYATGKKIFSLEKIIEMENRVQEMANEIRNKNYSPLEQVIAVYDIAKDFKPYRDGEADNTADSRALYEFLDNDYMVCAGYADLIVNLGHRLNAPYSDIGLGIIHRDGTLGEGHARNYVNIVDSKYGIDGFYVLEPTWEQAGQTKGRLEQFNSRYENCLLTTEEGRNNAEIGEMICIDPNNIYGGYDILLTMENTEEIQKYFKSKSYYTDEWFKRISILDPEFYKKMVTLDFSKEDINVLKNYFKTKVNNQVPKEKLLDAIMEVKRNKYVDYTEQDFEDMRMGYSITPPFCLKQEVWENKSLYGKEYDGYIKKRYEDIKNKTLKEAQEENPCLVAYNIYQAKIKEVLTNGITFGEMTNETRIKLTDSKLIELVKQNKEIIEKTGFSYSEIDYEKEFGLVGVEPEFKITLISESEELSQLKIEERIERIKTNVEQLCAILGVNKKIKSEELGKQTFEEQQDTLGKNKELKEITKQIEEQQINQAPNNHEK